MLLGRITASKVRTLLLYGIVCVCVCVRVCVSSQREFLRLILYVSARTPEVHLAGVMFAYLTVPPPPSLPLRPSPFPVVCHTPSFGVVHAGCISVSDIHLV